MKLLKMTAMLLAGMLLLSGCSAGESGNTGDPDDFVAAVQVQNGYASAEDAYNDYLRACLAGDAAALYSMYSDAEKAAASGISADYLGLDEEDYATYTALQDDAAFRSYLKNYMHSLHVNMDDYNPDPDAWSITPGMVDEPMDAQGFADATGLDVKEIVCYNYYFAVENKEDGAALAGKKVNVVQIGDQWYPSYIAEIRPDPLYLIG